MSIGAYDGDDVRIKGVNKDTPTDNETDGYVTYTEDGDRVRLDTSAAPVALSNQGLMTEVTVNSTGWTALPTTPLSGRKAYSIQNQGSQDVKINYNNGVGYVGKIIEPKDTIFTDIAPDIVVYGRAKNGTSLLLVEEIS